MVADLGERTETRQEDWNLCKSSLRLAQGGLSPCVPFTSTELDADTWERRKKMPGKAFLMLSCSGGLCVRGEGKEAFPLEPFLAKMVHMSKCLWGRGD